MAYLRDVYEYTVRSPFFPSIFSDRQIWQVKVPSAMRGKRPRWSWLCQSPCTVCVFLGCLSVFCTENFRWYCFFFACFWSFQPSWKIMPAPKFNSSPLKKIQARLVSFSSNHHFSGAILLLNFGGGSQLASFPPRNKLSPSLGQPNLFKRRMAALLFKVVELKESCQDSYPFHAMLGISEEKPTTNQPSAMWN